MEFKGNAFNQKLSAMRGGMLPNVSGKRVTELHTYTIKVEQDKVGQSNIYSQKFARNILSEFCKRHYQKMRKPDANTYISILYLTIYKNC